jgi:hypothetical protein
MATLAQLRVKVSRRLEDTANAHWSTAEIDDFINEARMDMWQLVRRENPSVLPLSTDTWTWPANSRSVDLSAAVNAGHGAGTDGGLNTPDFDIYLVSMTENTTAIDADNLPVPLPRIPYEEINRGSVGGSLWKENTTHFGGDNYSYTGVDGGASKDNAWHGGSKSAIHAWALQGHQLFLTPVPRTEVQMHVEYIAPFALLDDNADPIFTDANSMFRPWEAIVELGAVLAAKGRSDESIDPTMQQWGYKMELFSRWLEHREITGTPRVLINGY